MVSGPALLKLRLVPAAHPAGTACPFASFRSRQEESLRNSGASTNPRLLGAQSPSLGTTKPGCRKGSSVWVLPGKPGRAVSERPGRAMTDCGLHRSAGWTRPRQSGRSWWRVPA